MTLKIYLSGEIHTDWRDEIMTGAKGLDVSFSSPVTDHAASDDCGVAIMGSEENKFWHDRKGAQLNAIRTRKGIEDADVVVVRFGDKYKQWNAAFDAGYAAALGKSLIILHGPDHQHALKEVDAAALAVAEHPAQVVDMLRVLAAKANAPNLYFSKNTQRPNASDSARERLIFTNQTGRPVLKRPSWSSGRNA